MLDRICTAVVCYWSSIFLKRRMGNDHDADFDEDSIKLHNNVRSAWWVRTHINFKRSVDVLINKFQKKITNDIFMFLTIFKSVAQNSSRAVDNLTRT